MSSPPRGKIMHTSRWFEVPLLIFGVFCCSTAVIMIQASRTDPLLLASLRLLIAAAALSPLFFRKRREFAAVFHWRNLKATLLPAFLLAVHFVSWIYGARMTLAANSSLIVNLVPVVMPVLLLFTVRERLTRRELLATALAIAGLVILSASDFSVSREHFIGDLICFGSMLGFAGYLVLARQNQDFPSLWLYVVPLYAIAGVLCFAGSLLTTNPLAQEYDLKEILLILGLGFIPTVLGHSILNHAMKHLRGQVVSIINMGQFVFAGIMAYFLFGQTPQAEFYVASAMIVGSGVLAVMQAVQRQTTPAPPPEDTATSAAAAA